MIGSMDTSLGFGSIGVENRIFVDCFWSRNTQIAIKRLLTRLSSVLKVRSSFMRSLDDKQDWKYLKSIFNRVFVLSYKPLRSLFFF